MSPKKNILLFRGDNRESLRITLQAWREKFIEKHGDMNLLEIRDVSEGILGDCMTPGFMGGTRMVIFYEKLQKTEKEIEKIKEQKKIAETIDMEELLEGNLQKTQIDND